MRSESGPIRCGGELGSEKMQSDLSGLCMHVDVEYDEKKEPFQHLQKVGLFRGIAPGHCVEDATGKNRSM